jgi:NAD(P)-dependent dehydrogenase (short-subunit alcohol dehydrogenase family)
MDLGLPGKHAIVAGGSRGIGKAIARELTREGVDVAILARNKGDLAATAREAKGNSPAAKTLSELDL